MFCFSLYLFVMTCLMWSNEMVLYFDARLMYARKRSVRFGGEELGRVF